MFRHIWPYSESCVILPYAESEAYLEPLYIQIFGIFKTKDLFRILIFLELEVYSEPCKFSTIKRFAKIINSFNYFSNIASPKKPGAWGAASFFMS